MTKIRILKNLNIENLIKKQGLLTLLIIGIMLSIFYYFYIRANGVLESIHYYEYYLGSIVLSQKLAELQIGSFLQFFYNFTISDKLIYLRAIPAFLIFKPSYFIFTYSNFFLNYGLFIVLYFVINKIKKPIDSLILTLISIGSYFSIELFANYYVDLTYFIVSAMFFIYLYLFYKKPKKNFFSLALLIFLMFLTKNTSYLFVPLIGLFYVIIIIIIFKKEKKKKNNKRNRKKWYESEKITKIILFILSTLSGFLLYSIIILNLKIKNDILNIITASNLSTHNVFQTIITTLTKYHANWFFFLKFDSIILCTLIYLAVTYLIIRKKEIYWVILFFITEIFFIFLYNIKGHHYELRYFLPAYFVYIFIFFIATEDLLKKIFRRLEISRIKQIHKYILLILVSLLIIINLVKISSLEENDIFSAHSRIHSIQDNLFEIKIEVPSGSTIYTSNNECGYDVFNIMTSFIDVQNYNEEQIYNKDYTEYKYLDNRFNYQFGYVNSTNKLEDIKIKNNKTYIFTSVDKDKIQYLNQEDKEKKNNINLSIIKDYKMKNYDNNCSFKLIKIDKINKEPNKW